MQKANKTIAHFLDTNASVVVLNDLLIVRPFVCAIATSFGMNDNNSYETHLFVYRGAVMEAPLIRNLFARMFHIHGSHSISFLEYRHLVKHYALQLKIDITWQYDEEEASSESESIHAKYKPLCRLYRKGRAQ